MCDYCEPMERVDAREWDVFIDMADCYPVEVCAVMGYTSDVEAYLVKHAIDWYLALVQSYGSGYLVSVKACPVCGRGLG